MDRVRDVGWQGVAGNTDEMLWMPESLKAMVARSPGVRPLLAAIEEIATATSEALGEERVTWLRGLSLAQSHGSMTLVHASPESLWMAPGADATDGELESVYGPLGQAVAIYGHIHSPYVRNLPDMIVANTGSVSLSYDGDRRAS